MNSTMDLRDLSGDLSFGRPHVVLLGAGASRAAFPNGDSNGRQLPVMADIVAVCKLDECLMEAGIRSDLGDFERLFSDLVDSGSSVVGELEYRIRSYFEGLTMPDEPTMYDLLVLSLRKKDVIATFNWDPFLMQALRRTTHIHKRQGPRVVFLHGNSAVYYCPACRNPVRLGTVGDICRYCGSEFIESQLLYPIAHKNYSADAVIETSWKVVRSAMSSAYLFTIFGYGAPRSDVDAVKLLKDAWGFKFKRELEQVEMIDIRSEKDLCSLWGDFIVESHYDYQTSVENSWSFRTPRRTCEAFFALSMDLDYPLETPLRLGMTWDEIEKLIAPLVDHEIRHGQDKKSIPNT